MISGEAASQIVTTAATLQGEVEPKGAPTTYRFEYVDEASFNESGWAGARSLGEGEIADPKAPATPVSAPIAGLAPGTTYRFRIVATNHCNPLKAEEICTTEGEREGGGEVPRAFTTYPVPEAPLPCPNAALRVGPSAALPDCRAYELVTPPDAAGLQSGEDAGFDTSLASPAGESLIFGTGIGALPGSDGNGFADSYEAVRDAGNGWHNADDGPSGAQARIPRRLAVSPDHQYVLWEVYGSYGGSLSILDQRTTYIRRPEGVIRPECAPPSELEGLFEFVGCAEPGFKNETAAKPVWITAAAGHVIFLTGADGEAQQLREDAPPTETRAIYDRTPAGLHTVSLLPGDVTPAKGQSASYDGASADGSVVLFDLEGSTPLYARIDNAATVEVAESSWTFAGASQHGDRVFYVRPNAGQPFLPGTNIPQGDLFACDIRSGPCAGLEKTHDPIQIGSGEESILVNVSADGSRVYFVSPKQLDGSKGKAGADNLYLWDGTAIHFIATLDEADVNGIKTVEGRTEGLGLWDAAQDGARNSGPASHLGSATDPSRTTPDGSVLLFQSHADLTPPYEAKGHSEVYRYDASANGGAGGLACLSCNPTGAPASSDAQLQSSGNGSPVRANAPVANLSADARTVFFQSDDRLVPADTDGLTDVYEWEAEGAGGCRRPGGCVSLISSGQSANPNYLYAVSADGSNVFFDTVDSLVPQDAVDSPPSIYDARVDGGIPQPPAPPGECLGEACQPAVLVPGDATPASLVFNGPGNLLVQPAAKPTPKTLTRAQKLAKALKACAKKRKSQRKRCEAQARGRYGKKAKRATRARHASSHGRGTR